MTQQNQPSQGWEAGDSGTPPAPLVAACSHTSPAVVPDPAFVPASAPSKTLYEPPYLVEPKSHNYITAAQRPGMRLSLFYLFIFYSVLERQELSVKT